MGVVPAIEGDSLWSLAAAIELLKFDISSRRPPTPPPVPKLLEPIEQDAVGTLGDFSSLWKELEFVQNDTHVQDEAVNQHESDTVAANEFAQLVKGVKWRDEADGADLEDNVEPEVLSGSALRTRKRAARRARARERELKAREEEAASYIETDTGSSDDAGEELERLRRSPDRRGVIASLLGRPRPHEVTPPTSPSPPKESSRLRTPSKKEWPVSNPFLWTAPISSPSKTVITAQDGLTPRLRKIKLINQLAQQYQTEAKYLKNSGLQEPAFSPLNTSSIGVHVFIDMSNISIGFHDCLKAARGIPIETRVKRIPMDFHNLSLVLERGRPAAKRILSGSDRTSAVDQAATCGYETNILERVHKQKTPTPKRRTPKKNGGGYASSGLSHGETSGSETPAYNYNVSKWSEQAVDEILHLKMSHSILDAEKPSTIVLATGDAAEAEYSDGFLRMVERALNRGWMVELVSFRMNTSSLYKRHEFRNKWGNMFKWVQLDDFVESLIAEEEK